MSEMIIKEKTCKSILNDYNNGVKCKSYEFRRKSGNNQEIMRTFITKRFMSLKQIITNLENYPINFWQWIIGFLSIVYIRNLFESFSGRIILPFPIAYLLQYTLAFINPLLTLSIILSLFSKETIVKVSKLMLFAWLFVLTPPLFDILLGRAKEVIGYLPVLGNQSIFYLYLNFFNPFITLPGTTIGIRLETVIACLLAFLYVMLKTNRLSRAFFSAVVVYFVSIAFYTLPYNIFNAWKLIWPSLPNATELYLGEGLIVRNPFVRLTYSIANNDLVLLSILLLVWCRLYCKRMFYGTVRRLFSRESLLSLAYFTIGILTAVTVFRPYPPPENAAHPFDIVVFAALTLSVLAMSGVNNILLTKKDDFDHKHHTLVVMAFFALTIPLVIGFALFAVALTIVSLFFIDYVFVSKNVKLRYLRPIIASLISLCSVFFGFSIYAREHLTKVFNPSLMIALILILMCQSYFVSSSNNKVKYVSGFAWALGIIFFPVIVKSPFSVLLFFLASIAALFILMATTTKIYVGSIPYVLNILFLGIFLLFSKSNASNLSRQITSTPKAYSKALLGEYFTISRERECANIQIEKAINLGCRDLDAILTAAYNYSLFDQVDRSIEKCRMAIQIDSNSIYAHLYLAVNLHQKGNADEAVGELQKVLRLDPNNTHAKNYLALIRTGSGLPKSKTGELLTAGQNELLLGNTTKAAMLMKSAIALDSTSVPAYLLLAKIYDRINQPDSAIYFYEKAISYEPQNAREKYLDFLLSRNYLPKAVEQLNALIGLDSNNAVLFLNLGFCYTQLNRMDLAEQQFLHVIRLDKRDIMGRYNLSLFYLNQNRTDEAISHLNDALGIEPNNVRIRNRLGYAYAAKGLNRRAIEEWNHCLKVDPDFKEAKDNISKLNTSGK
ncbi:tetratricopeptide repeat protein [Candidatus Bathyarchaeota archaeon]|nr:tetratricopeptide repeat protein [Candidatus Bathyarchaeota archaeon]